MADKHETQSLAEVIELYPDEGSVETAHAFGKRTGRAAFSADGIKRLTAIMRRELDLKGRNVGKEVVIFPDHQDTAVGAVTSIMAGIINTHPEELGLCLVPFDRDVDAKPYPEGRRSHFICFAGYEAEASLTSKSRRVMEMADEILQNVGADLRLCHDRIESFV